MYILKIIKRVAITLSAFTFAVMISSSNVFANDVKIIMITHGTASEEFWAPVKKGAEDAAGLASRDGCQDAAAQGRDLIDQPAGIAC